MDKTSISSEDIKTFLETDNKKEIWTRGIVNKETFDALPDEAKPYFDVYKSIPKGDK